MEVVKVLALDASGKGETVKELGRTHALQNPTPISSVAGFEQGEEL